MIPPKCFDIFSPSDWGMLIRSRCVQIFLEIIPTNSTVPDTCYGDKQMNFYWKDLLDTAKKPRKAADLFFLFILSNVSGRPIVLHGERLSAVPIGKAEMRG